MPHHEEPQRHLFWIGKRRLIQAKPRKTPRFAGRSPVEVVAGSMRFIVFEGNKKFGIYRKLITGKLQRVHDVHHENPIQINVRNCVSLVALPKNIQNSEGKTTAIVAHVPLPSNLLLSKEARQRFDVGTYLNDALDEVEMEFSGKKLRFIAVPGADRSEYSQIMHELREHCRKNDITLEEPMGLSRSPQGRSVFLFKHPKSNIFGIHVDTH